MEVSSHALALGRADAIPFDVAAFTNFGRDHLDFHGDEETYFEAKAQLFTPDRARRGGAEHRRPARARTRRAGARRRSARADHRQPDPGRRTTRSRRAC